MLELYKDNKFDTQIGEFKVVSVDTGSDKLVQNGTHCITGYDMQNRIFYIRSDCNGIERSYIVKSFIRAINNHSEKLFNRNEVSGIETNFDKSILLEDIKQRLSKLKAECLDDGDRLLLIIGSFNKLPMRKKVPVLAFTLNGKMYEVAPSSQVDVYHSAEFKSGELPDSIRMLSNALGKGSVRSEHLNVGVGGLSSPFMFNDTKLTDWFICVDNFTGYPTLCHYSAETSCTTISRLSGLLYKATDNEVELNSIMSNMRDGIGSISQWVKQYRECDKLLFPFFDIDRLGTTLSAIKGLGKPLVCAYEACMLNWASQCKMKAVTLMSGTHYLPDMRKVQEKDQKKEDFMTALSLFGGGGNLDIGVETLYTTDGEFTNCAITNELADKVRSFKSLHRLLIDVSDSAVLKLSTPYSSNQMVHALYINKVKAIDTKALLPRDRIAVYLEPMTLEELTSMFISNGTICTLDITVNYVDWVSAGRLDDLMYFYAIYILEQIRGDNLLTAMRLLEEKPVKYVANCMLCDLKQAPPNLEVHVLNGTANYKDTRLSKDCLQLLALGMLRHLNLPSGNLAQAESHILRYRVYQKTVKSVCRDTFDSGYTIFGRNNDKTRYCVECVGASDSLYAKLALLYTYVFPLLKILKLDCEATRKNVNSYISVWDKCYKSILTSLINDLSDGIELKPEYTLEDGISTESIIEILNGVQEISKSLSV